MNYYNCPNHWCNYWGGCQRRGSCFLDTRKSKKITIMINYYIQAYHEQSGKTFYLWLNDLPTSHYIALVDALHDASFKVNKCSKQTYDAQVRGRDGDPDLLVYNPFGTYFHIKDAEIAKLVMDTMEMELKLEYIDVVTELGFIQTYMERGDTISMIIQRCMQMMKDLRQHSWYLYKEGETEPLRAAMLASRVIKSGMLLELRRA